MSKFYITTAIDYVNSRPHLGTAYEKITADVIARYKRLAGVPTHFLMGNDEHSLNVFPAGEGAGPRPAGGTATRWSGSSATSGPARRVVRRLHPNHEDRNAPASPNCAPHPGGRRHLRGALRGLVTATPASVQAGEDLVGGLVRRAHARSPTGSGEELLLPPVEVQQPLLDPLRQAPEALGTEVRARES